MKKFLFSSALLLIFAVPVFAHPPTDLELSYDKSTGVLSVKMKHVTIDQKDHFIRLIHVTVNQNEPQEFRYVRQTYPSVVEVLLPVVAKAGSVIQVEAICNKGGSVEGSITVPEDEKAKGESTNVLQEEPEYEPEYGSEQPESKPAPSY